MRITPHDIKIYHRSQIRQDYPLNLSISVSGGKETNKDSRSNGEWTGNSSNLKSGPLARIRIVVWRGAILGAWCAQVSWNGPSQRVRIPFGRTHCLRIRGTLEESSCLGMQLKSGGKLHPRLNIGKRPIANKYREGKMKSTLKREWNSAWNC